MASKKLTKEELIELHPDVFTPEVMASGIPGPGWYPLIEELVTDLKALGWDKQILQAKNKWNGLKFYVNPGQDAAIYKRIAVAEEESFEYCWSCGAENGKFTSHKKDCWTVNREPVPKPIEE